jgi:hypothetical protein
MKSLDEYSKDTVHNFMKDITDHVFLYIQNNEELMREYQSMVNSYGLDEVNKKIGFTVKEEFGLGNLEENKKPKSWLIKSYTRHCKK